MDRKPQGGGHACVKMIRPTHARYVMAGFMLCRVGRWAWADSGPNMR